MISPTASVVVCAYTLDRWELLQAAIRSVMGQLRPGDELLVVSDHNEALLDLVRSAFPMVTAIENREPRGLSGARNTGISSAKGTIVAFVDDDAAVEPGWLAGLVGGFEDPRVQGVGGPILASWAGRRPRWFPEEFDWVIGCSYRGQDRSVAVRNLIGANMSFRRALFDRVGGFRTTLGRVGDRPVGGEETELCIRAAAADPSARFVLRPDVRVRHHVPASRATLRYFVRRCFAEGLSKAVITRVVGQTAGLSSERDYVMRTLPAGVGRGVRDAVRGNPWGLVRAAAIIGGLSATTIGYLVGTARSMWVRTTQGAVTGSRP